LGGHLATAFARLFPNIPVEVATVNGMGTGSDSRVGAFFDALAERQGTSFPENRIANVFGSAGPNLATGELIYNQFGLRTQLFTEAANLTGPSGVFGHGKQQMTDSMAVYDLFVRISDTLQAGTPAEMAAFLMDIFRAATPIQDFTLESVVNI